MKHNGIKKLVVVGGGTAGWVAAAALAKQLSPERYEITVVESSHISSTGVGESVVPTVVDFMRNLGLDEQDFIRETQVSLKLGIKHRDWHEKGKSYFHPFGALGQECGELSFFQCWLKARATGDLTPLMDYSPAAVMAAKQKFVLPFDFPTDSPLAGADYAYHLDANLVGRHLSDFAGQRGVKSVNGHVVRVNLGDDGHIRSLDLNNQQTIHGDFFIDCSGSRGLLIDEILNSDYQSWKHFLFCDRAVVVLSKHSGEISPYTTSTARDNGWTWHIPLRNQVSTGYVFSSNHCSDNHAIEVLLNMTDGKLINEPYIIPFDTGMRKQLWKKNCIAVGLSGGFIEPLESSAIHLITRGVRYMLELFPDLHQGERDWSSLMVEYNSRMRLDFEEIRDFIIAHYCTANRVDTEFWRDCKTNPIPASLAHRIELFRSRGELHVTEDRLFSPASWQSLFIGMGVIPRSYHPFVDMADFDVIRRLMKSDCVQLQEAVGALPG